MLLRYNVEKIYYILHIQAFSEIRAQYPTTGSRHENNAIYQIYLSPKVDAGS